MALSNTLQIKLLLAQVGQPPLVVEALYKEFHRVSKLPQHLQEEVLDKVLEALPPPFEEITTSFKEVQESLARIESLLRFERTLKEALHKNVGYVRSQE